MYDLRGYKNGALGTNGLININSFCTHFINLAGRQLAGSKFFQVGISSVGIIRVATFRVGVFLDGSCPGGSFPGWEFSLVEVFRVGVFMLSDTRKNSNFYLTIRFRKPPA